VTTPDEQVRAEAELARRLAQAPEDERRRLYGPAYDRIYEMHLSREPDVLEFGATPGLVPLLLGLTREGDSALEVGCGTGLLVIELARAGREVTGVDVAEVALEIARRRAGEARLVFDRVEGVALPYADASFDFAYSVEVVEHLHERDARAHFAEVRRILRPSGRYWILTPSRLASVAAAERFGADADAGADVHLKEWTYGELHLALRDAGFPKVSMLPRDRPGVPAVPALLASALEGVLPRGRLFARCGLDRCSVVARA
jgi:SAM-dependent methyltransferase